MSSRETGARSVPTGRLGTTGVELTRVGLGTWELGGGGYQGSWGPQDDRESIRAIHHAVERGVNWIDTAAAYGLGHAEVVVARAIAQLSDADRPYVFTKCGLVWEDGRTTFRNVLAPDSIRRECEASLRRLGVEAIDLYLLHWPSEDGTAIEDSWSTMAELVDAGNVRAVGLSNFGVADLERCEAIRHVDALQPELSLIARDAAAEPIRWAARRGTGVIVYSPMGSGLLTGWFSHERFDTLAHDDWRRGHWAFREPALSRNLALVARLEPVAERLGCTLPELVVAWTLAWPGVTGAIAGARIAEHVDSWIGAADIQLKDRDLDEIAAAVAETKAGRGPVAPVAQ